MGIDDSFIGKELSEEEIDDLTKEAAINESSLGELLQRQQATIQELLLLTGSETPDEVRRMAREFGLNHLKAALEEIADIMVGGEKEQTRLSAAKSIVAIAMATTDHDGDDKISELFEKIAKNAKGVSK